MKRIYTVTPRCSAVSVEGRSPFEAEKQAREQHPHLRGEDLIIVAAKVAWEREANKRGRSHTERLEDFREQAEAAGA